MSRGRYRSTVYAAPAGGEDIDSLRTPNGIPGLLFWARPDIGVTDAGGGKVSAEVDVSGSGHGLTQATGARQPSAVAAEVGGQVGLRFGSAASDNFWLDWANWNQPNACTVLAVVKYKRPPADDYQCLSLGTSGPTCYLNNPSAGDARPVIYANNPDGERARWSTNLVDGSLHVVKFAWTMGVNPSHFYTQVDNATEVHEQVASLMSVGQFNSVGMDTGVVGTQDLFSSIGELRIYDHVLTPTEYGVFRSYSSARFGTV